MRSPSQEVQRENRFTKCGKIPSRGWKGAKKPVKKTEE